MSAPRFRPVRTLDDAEAPSAGLGVPAALFLMLLAVVVACVLAGISMDQAQRCNAAVQNLQAAEPPKLQFVVFDLLDDSAGLSHQDVVDVVEAVQLTTNRDVAPAWGFGGQFTVLPRGVVAQDVSPDAVLVYLFMSVDDEALDSWYGTGANHYAVMPPPNDCGECDGPQPNNYISSPAVPSVPSDQRIIAIPYGSPRDQDFYGLQGVSGAPVHHGGPFDGQTAYSGCDDWRSLLGLVLSHEVDETISDSYNGFAYAGNFFMVTPNFDGYVNMTFMDGADPFSHGPYNHYYVNGVCITNWALPSFFSTEQAPGRRVDFLGKSPGPSIPYGGTTTLIGIDPSGCVMFNYYNSVWYDPANYAWIEGYPIGGSCASSSSADRPRTMRRGLRIAE